MTYIHAYTHRKTSTNIHPSKTSTYTYPSKNVYIHTPIDKLLHNTHPSKNVYIQQQQYHHTTKPKNDCSRFWKRFASNDTARALQIMEPHQLFRRDGLPSPQLGLASKGEAGYQTTHNTQHTTNNTQQTKPQQTTHNKQNHNKQHTTHNNTRNDDKTKRRLVYARRRPRETHAPTRTHKGARETFSPR